MINEYINLFGILNILYIVKYIFIIDKNYNKWFLTGDMNNLELEIKEQIHKPRRDGEYAISVNGETTRMICGCGCTEEVEIPIYVLDEEGRIKNEYCRGVWLKGERFGKNYSEKIWVVGREFSNGAFVSGEGTPYFNLDCWSNHCSD